MIDKQKMAAFAGAKHGGSSNKDGKDQGGDDQGDQGEPATDFATYAGGKYADLASMLEDNAAVVEDAASGLDIEPANVLDGQDVAQEVVQALTDGVDDLPDDLQEKLAVLSDATADDLKALAAHLASSGLVEDGDRVAAWLYLVAKNVEGNDFSSAGGEEGDDSDPYADDYSDGSGPPE